MSEDRGLKSSREGTTLTLTIARPDRGNAMSAALVEALLDQIEGAAEEGVRLLVFDGEGRNFCSGFDFTGIEEETDASLTYRFVRMESLLQAVFYAPFETLCLAQGRVFGAGADLFNACARRVAAPGASFRMPGLSFGIVLGSRRFVATTGDAGRAILSEGRAFEAEEALRIGFAEAVMEEERWPDFVAQTARRVERLPADSAARLNAAARPFARAEADADMAALVRSASRPGLKARMQAYRAEVEKARAAKK